ncbi:hypothetical protein [Oceanidesulfovibrio marinus]|uniref:Uncharacterized protein n=1 Tax=Oceanidesulfovibrio marinus TaxID=370038 RepID=A0A6P1ZBP0_9BACT|nr:hypothetical protein [Oceanidesulfovibrio marinus]QJT09659.1 hypothetical protein E8L03_12255 [Oceanidesulfovibrio marinus]TVM31021.1 hypothetical protein DQK91_19480 [Oceanidesulfovibrio marinus]
MNTKGSRYGAKSRSLRKAAEEVEGLELGEVGMDEAELTARIAALDMDGTLPEPLAAALRTLSGGLRRSHDALHGDDGTPAE